MRGSAAFFLSNPPLLLLYIDFRGWFLMWNTCIRRWWCIEMLLAERGAKMTSALIFLTPLVWEKALNKFFFEHNKQLSEPSSSSTSISYQFIYLFISIWLFESNSRNFRLDLIVLILDLYIHTYIHIEQKFRQPPSLN